MKVLLFGATGAAGGAVLTACLKASVVDEVRAITRKPLTITHAKLRNILHADFLDYSAIASTFEGVDACLFCLGVSITKVSRDEYQRITHDFTLAAARTLLARSPSAAFHYISGKGTRPDSRMFWAQVKARTELELTDLIGADCWRPAFIDTPPSPSFPRIFTGIYPLLRLFKPFNSMYVHGEDLGRAMLQATLENLRKRIIENPEIRAIAARAKS
jgi:uncharacterized protein YbjT (DUF2867 family)